jgi:hypothetical protein
MTRESKTKANELRSDRSLPSPLGCRIVPARVYEQPALSDTRVLSLDRALGRGSFLSHTIVA